MTDKQVQRVKAKIEKYKKTLAADKKYWGGQYHDGQGIRYLIRTTWPSLIVLTNIGSACPIFIFSGRTAAGQ